MSLDSQCMPGKALHPMEAREPKKQRRIQITGETDGHPFLGRKIPPTAVCKEVEFRSPAHETVFSDPVQNRHAAYARA